MLISKIVRKNLVHVKVTRFENVGAFPKIKYQREKYSAQFTAPLNPPNPLPVLLVYIL